MKCWVRKFLILIVGFSIFTAMCDRKTALAAAAGVIITYCDGMVVQGTSTAPYVGLTAAVLMQQVFFDSNSVGYPSFYAPVVGGSYNFSVRFAAQPIGTPININVYGSTSTAPGGWDGQDFINNHNVPCSGNMPQGEGAGACHSQGADDGRLNSVCHDPAQTAAVYCDQAGTVSVYAVDESMGHLAFEATRAEIQHVPANPVRNTLIKAGRGASLYRLTTGELQVNRDGYHFIFNDCAK